MHDTIEVLLFTSNRKFQKRLEKGLVLDANVRIVGNLDQVIRFLARHPSTSCVVIDPDPAVKMADLRTFLDSSRKLDFQGVLLVASNDPSKAQTLMDAGFTMSAHKDMVAAKIIDEIASC